MPSKLYVVTRQDLTPGAQIAQSAHAALKFSYEHTEIFRKWHDESQYLICLSVPDEDALLDFMDEVWRRKLKYSYFVEPDFGDEHTAVCIEPGFRTSNLCQGLPLALKEIGEGQLLRMV